MARQRSDVERFLAASVQKKRGARTKAADLYLTYVEWCAAMCFDRRHPAAFAREMQHLGIEASRGRENVYPGIRLLPRPERSDVLTVELTGKGPVGKSHLANFLTAAAPFLGFDVVSRRDVSRRKLFQDFENGEELVLRRRRGAGA